MAESKYSILTNGTVILSVIPGRQILVANALSLSATIYILLYPSRPLAKKLSRDCNPVSHLKGTLGKSCVSGSDTALGGRTYLLQSRYVTEV
jgi:hypothetical protein